MKMQLSKCVSASQCWPDHTPSLTKLPASSLWVHIVLDGPSHTHTTTHMVGAQIPFGPLLEVIWPDIVHACVDLSAILSDSLCLHPYLNPPLTDTWHKMYMTPKAGSKNNIHSNVLPPGMIQICPSCTHRTPLDIRPVMLWIKWRVLGCFCAPGSVNLAYTECVDAVGVMYTVVTQQRRAEVILKGPNPAALGYDTSC